MVDKLILVTGGAGFIGSNFIYYILKKKPNWKIVNLDDLTYAGQLENLKDISNSNYTFIKGNICDQMIVERILVDYSINTIVHFAAETHVDRSIENPEPFIVTNIVGTYKLLEACRKIWLKGNDLCEGSFHHISTDEVYGMLDNDSPAFTENSSYSPNSPYSASKASSDHLVRAYHHTYNLPITITNSSNNYGPYQYPEKFIPLIIHNAVIGKHLPIYGHGNHMRDWLYVNDHCEAILGVLIGGKNGETYNIGGRNQISNINLVETICNLIDEYLPQSPNVPHKKLIKFTHDRPGHDFRYEMNSLKIENELGWSPKHTFIEGLRTTIKWYLQNPEWMSKITGKKEFLEMIWKFYEK